MNDPVFQVAFNPVPTANRVAVATSRLVRWSWLSLVLVAGAVVLFETDATTRSTLGSWGIGVLLALVALSLVSHVVRLLRARAQLGRIGSGPALEADGEQLVLHGLDGVQTTLAWSQVERVRAAPPLPAAEPTLQVLGSQGQQWQVPLSQLATLPGGIDAGLRACSGGRVGVDLSGLDALV